MDNIILIGFMGSGKSSIAKKLAKKISVKVIDVDKYIERRENRTITEIFAKEGEEYFRDVETEVLEEFLQSGENFILSAGGGLPLRERNRQIFKKIGKTIYLKASPETIYSRIGQDTKRPLLQCEDPKSRITELMKSRENIYEDAADITIVTDDMSMEEVAEHIRRILNENTCN